MHLQLKFRCLLVAATSAGMLLSGQLALAEGLATVAPSTNAPPKLAPHTMTDVELLAGGVLAGRIVNARGTGLGNSNVTLASGNVVVAETTSDTAGNFRFESVRGGVYHVGSGNVSAMYRAWAPHTAPPGVAQSVMLVPSQNVVAGQYSPMKYWLADPLVIGGIIAVGAGVPIILAQQNNDSGS